MCANTIEGCAVYWRCVCQVPLLVPVDVTLLPRQHTGPLELLVSMVGLGSGAFLHYHLHRLVMPVRGLIA